MEKEIEVARHEKKQSNKKEKQRDTEEPREKNESAYKHHTYSADIL